MRFTPHLYQQFCVNKLLNDPYVGLMLDMGLG